MGMLTVDQTGIFESDGSDKTGLKPMTSGSQNVEKLPNRNRTFEFSKFFTKISQFVVVRLLRVFPFY